MEMLSLIIPCYNEEQVLPILYEELKKVASEMKDNSFEFIFVNDGSRDNTLSVIKGFEDDSRVKYISFSRNFGKEAAILAGLDAAEGDYVAVMDADMQDPPSMLPEMIAAIKEQGADSAATRRISRTGEPPIRSFFANLFYKILNKTSGLNVMGGSRDFRLMKKEMVDAVRELPETDRFSKGLYEWVGFKTVWLEYKNVERAAGVTKWSFIKLFKYAVNGIVSFTTAPLKLATLLGILSVAAAAVWTVVDIVRATLYGSWIVGLDPVIIAVLAVGGIIMLLLGIIGQYLSHIFNEVKGRPEYIVKESNVYKK
ncbi:MAG: glycosyltransferase family 2 protein [Clostridia bacterium]|nr:glycosyltransferase family 2 protein [Clostridia bacterium]